MYLGKQDLALHIIISLKIWDIMETLEPLSVLGFSTITQILCAQGSQFLDISLRSQGDWTLNIRICHRLTFSVQNEHFVSIIIVHDYRCTQDKEMIVKSYSFLLMPFNVLSFSHIFVKLYPMRMKQRPNWPQKPIHSWWYPLVCFVVILWHLKWHPCKSLTNWHTIWIFTSLMDVKKNHSLI